MQLNPKTTPQTKHLANVALTITAILCVPARAQTAALPKFEWVSISHCRYKTNERGGEPNAPGRNPTEKLSLNCQTVELLIEEAYGAFATGSLKPQFRAVKIEGAPAWAHSKLFTIEARPETPQSRGMMYGPMMQQVLKDRFKLKLRIKPTEVPVYWLVADGGAKDLAPHQSETCVDWDFDHPPQDHPRRPGNPCGAISLRIDSTGRVTGLKLPGITMATLAERLSTLVDRDVIDKTGISGRFDIQVQVAPDELNADARPRLLNDQAPFVSAAVTKLGLKLESAKGPGEIFVIGHIELPKPDLAIR